MSQNILVSYANEYDLYEGEGDIGSLPAELQDDLIKLTLGTDGNSRGFVMKHNIKKSQAEGLWSLVVMLGFALENKGAINNFESRTYEDIQLIIEQLAEFALWQRLEEAYPPFDFLEKKTEYDWSELEKITLFFEEHAGESLYEIQMALFSVLANRDVDYRYDTRMSFECCKAWLKEEKINLHQDRMLANLAGASGKVKTNSPIIFFGATALLIAMPIVWFFTGFLAALGTLACAIFAFKAARASLRDAVYSAALTSNEKYRWFMSRKILWITYIDEV